MKFNLLETGYVTTSGTVSFDVESIEKILAVIGTVTISGSNNDEVYIYGNIVDRVGTYQIRYYFDSSTSSGTVASGIHFYYKNDVIDSYLSLITNIGGGYYYTTVPDLSAPRYIKLNHTVSGTAIDGTIIGLEVLNDDSVVDFGADGNLTSSTTLTSLNYLNYNDYIKEIEIYNSGSSIATAHVFIDPQYNDSDKLLSISNSENGPWVFSRNTDYIISNGDNWLAGKYYNTYTFKYSNAWDAVNIHYNIALSNNNTTATSTYNSFKSVIAVQGISQDMLFSKKWYWEIYVDNKAGATDIEIGIGPATLDVFVMLNANSNTYYYKSNGNKCSSSSCTAYGDTYTTGDTIGIAFDGNTGKIWFSKNGVWQDSGDPGTDANPAYSGISLNYTYMPVCGLYNSGDKVTASFIVGSAYTPPEGFLVFEIFESDGKLRLYSNALVGSYTTPIFKNDSVKYAYIDILDTSVSGAIIAVDGDDYTSTIEIRSSSSKPMNYNVYREVYTGADGNRLVFYYRDYLISSDIEVYDSRDATGTYLGKDYYTAHYIRHSDSFYIDQLNGKFVYLEAHRGWDNHNIVGFGYIYISTYDGRNIVTLQLAHCDQSIKIDNYYMDMDGNDGVWLYLYTNTGGGILNTTGYFLLHFDSNLTQLYKEYLSSDFVIGCDVVKDDSGALWYSRTGEQAILKISSTGEILLTYDFVTSVGRLCSTYDGGCWFIDDGSLYKLNSDGELEDSITNLEITNELTWVMRDENDPNFLWVIDGIYIKLISLDGRVHKLITFEGFTIYKLYSTKEYLIIYCTDVSFGYTYTKLIGRASGSIDKSILLDASSSTSIEAGIGNISYDNHTVLGNKIPLEKDSVWNDSLEWNKEVTDNAVLPREEYNQLKLTLRRPSTDIDSPTVENIYYQDNVEIRDIYPGQSKTLYLRINLPDGITIGGDYESNLRVWWELPVV